MTTDLMKRWIMTVWNRRVTILVFMGTLATDDRDKVMEIVGEFMVLLGYRMYEAYFVTFTDMSYFLCFSGQRGTIAL